LTAGESEAAGAAGAAEGEAPEGAGAAGGTAAADTRPSPREFRPVTRLQDIHFDFDAYVIRSEDTPILDANADWMISNPDHLVLIEGHGDERGTNQYNLALGDHRAKAAQAYMVSRGVQADRITTLSYGEERPFCTARTESCWAMNRRAHFLVKPARPSR
jgi:peptidoglycan-associated lipoprotein